MIENELRARDLWIDLTLLPPMQQVTEIATKILSRNIYQLCDISLWSSKSMRDRKKQNDFMESNEESVDDILSISSSSGTFNEELSYGSEQQKKKLSERKRKGSMKEGGPKKTKDKEKSPPKADQNTQSNIEDLAEQFNHLELQLSKREHQEPQLQSPRSSVYCFMCGQSDHGIRDCPDSKYFIMKGICRLDVNHRVVMSDGSELPQSEGDGGAARVIHD